MELGEFEIQIGVASDDVWLKKNIIVEQMNLVNMGNKILFLCVSLLAYVNSYAKVVLPAYFTDNMREEKAATG